MRTELCEIPLVCFVFGIKTMKVETSGNLQRISQAGQELEKREEG